MVQAGGRLARLWARDDEDRIITTPEQQSDWLENYRQEATGLFCPHGEHIGAPCGPCSDQHKDEDEDDQDEDDQTGGGHAI